MDVLTVSCHAGFPGDSGGDDDDVRADEGFLETSIGGEIAGHLSGGVDVV